MLRHGCRRPRNSIAEQSEDAPVGLVGFGNIGAQRLQHFVQNQAIGRIVVDHEHADASEVQRLFDVTGPGVGGSPGKPKPALS